MLARYVVNAPAPRPSPESTPRPARRGFTLIEILIVVIILGILAAIVIPQFTNASTDARSSSVKSSLQGIRFQLELFKVQHSDVPPQLGTDLWALMLARSSTGDTNVTVGTGTSFGPYFPSVPVNPVNSLTAVTNAPASGYGWSYTYDSNNNYTILALDNTGVALTY